MAMTDIAFRNFLSFLAPEARALLLAIAERLAAVLRQGKSPAHTSNAIAAAMPGLPVDDQLAILWCAIKRMPETPTSFELQYLQAESRIENEDRSYAVLSNIMKIKHATLRNWVFDTR